MKKASSLLAALLLLAALVSGCATAQPTTAPTAAPAAQTTAPEAQTTAPAATAEATPAPTAAPVENFIYLRPGAATPDHDAVMAAVNKKLADDNAGIQITVNFIPWDAWQQKVNLELTNGTQIDMMHVMNDWITLSTYVGQGALQDIGALVDQYGPNIKKLNPPIQFASATVNGKLYAMPAFWVEFSRDPSMTVRKDILDQNGLSLPKTADDVTNILKTVFANWKGAQKPYVYPPDIHRSYDTWPFTVIDNTFYVDQQGNVKAWAETDEFKKDCEFANMLYKSGYVNPDILTLKNEDRSNQIKSGSWVIGSGTEGSGDIESMKANYPNVTKDDVVHVLLYPDKPDLRPYGTRNMNAVPITAKYPDAGVRFINWLYEKQDNYDLYAYGIQGKDWNPIGDKQYEPIKDTASGNLLYNSDEWEFGNLAFIRTTTTNSPTCNRDLYTLDDNAVNSIAANFVFDPSNVTTELANVHNEEKASVTPMTDGVVSYADGYAKALDSLKKAGLDKVVAEFQKQFADYLAKTGK